MGCDLEVFHCHVGDQLYYSDEEYLAVYPDGQLPQVDRDWISLGKTDHRQHVHVSLKPGGIMPGTIVTTSSDGTVRPARASDHSPTGIAIDINASSDALDSVTRAIRLIQGTQTPR